MDASPTFPGSSGGGSVPSLSVSGPSGWGPTSGTFIFPGQLLVTLTGTGGGARLGGSTSGWVHLLLIRSCLGCFLPSGGGRLLLWHSRSRLADASGSGCSRLTSWPGTSTNTSSCQQILCSGSRQRVHGLKWRHPRWRVTRVSYPSRRGAGRGLGGRDHGCVAHCGWCPQGRCWTRKLVRDGGAPTPLADSKAVSAVSHLGQSLQSVKHTHYVCLWAVHCRLRRQYHARGDILHVSGPLGQTIAQQVNRSRPR